MSQAKQHSVCFISPFAYPLLSGNGSGAGGAERQFFLFGRELSRKGWRVVFISDVPVQKRFVLSTLLPVIHSRFSYMGGSNLFIPYDWLHFLYAMRCAAADYYIVKTPAHLMAPMAFYCWLANKKLIFWAQTSSDFKSAQRNACKGARILYEWGLKKADIIIAQSREQCLDIVKNFGINACHVPSICGTLINDKNRRGYQKDIRDDIDVLWVGNSLPLKRSEIVIELAKRMPKVMFAIAMNKADIDRFEQTAIAANSLSNVKFLGEVSPYEMESWFRRSKIFLNTSSREGFPNTFLQAWMNRMPVISLEIDPDSLISEENLGRIANKDDVLRCGDDILKLSELLIPFVTEFLSNSELRQFIGELGKKNVENNHSEEICVLKLLDALIC